MIRILFLILFGLAVGIATQQVLEAYFPGISARTVAHQTLPGG